MNDAADWIVIPNNHPAIIDQGTFDAVQERLTARQKKTTPHVNGGKFVLTGLIRCGKCGGTMFGTIPNKGQAVQYVCSTNHQTGGCDRNASKQDTLLSAVVDAIVERFTNPAIFQRMRDTLHEKAKAATTKTNVERTRKQLTTIENKLDKAERRLVEVDSDMVPVVSGQIRELTSKRDELQAAVKAAQTPTKRRVADVGAKTRRWDCSHSSVRRFCVPIPCGCGS
jgi:site-specific DNA recombinase